MHSRRRRQTDSKPRTASGTASGCGCTQTTGQTPAQAPQPSARDDPSILRLRPQSATVTAGEAETFRCDFTSGPTRLALGAEVAVDGQVVEAVGAVVPSDTAFVWTPDIRIPEDAPRETEVEFRVGRVASPLPPDAMRVDLELVMDTRSATVTVVEDPFDGGGGGGQGRVGTLVAAGAGLATGYAAGELLDLF